MKKFLFLLCSVILVTVACERRPLEYQDRIAFENSSRIVEKCHEGNIHEFLVVYAKKGTTSYGVSVTHWPSCKYCPETIPEREGCLPPAPDNVKNQMTKYNGQLKQIQNQLIVPHLLLRDNE